MSVYPEFPVGIALTDVILSSLRRWVPGGVPLRHLRRPPEVLEKLSFTIYDYESDSDLEDRYNASLSIDEPTAKIQHDAVEASAIPGPVQAPPSPGQFDRLGSNLSLGPPEHAPKDSEPNFGQPSQRNVRVHVYVINGTAHRM